MEFLNVLSRSEMKNVKGGNEGLGGCYLTCDGCNNSTCQGYVTECDMSAIYQMCGPGYAGGNGPSGICACS